MTITQLKYILAVAEHKSFTRAAEHVHVTQPTLSMQIQKLEEELEVQIFERGGKSVSLTEVGEKIVKQAQNIVNESERIQDIIEQQKGYIGGDFKLGIIPTIMPTILPLFLKTFIDKYPKVNLIVQEVSTEKLMVDLETGLIDAGIAATPLGNSRLYEKVLYYEPFEAYIPSNLELSKKREIKEDDLNIDDILLLKDGHCFKESILNLCNVKKERGNARFNLQSGSFETIVKLCDEGLGMTLLPYLHSRGLEEWRKSKIRSFESPSPAREVSLVYPKNKLKIHIIEVLEKTISGLVKGAIKYEDIKIISPLKNF